MRGWIYLGFLCRRGLWIFPPHLAFFRFLGVHAALATNISSVFSPLIASRVNLYIFEDVLGEMLTFGTPGGVLTRAKCAPRAFFRDVCVLLSK